MGQYSKQGLYSGYKKNNKEREALDYYSTPTKEVENILKTMKLNLEGKKILEPCVGGGHMLQGILNYCLETNQCPKEIIATDVMDRNPSISVSAKEEIFAKNMFGYDVAKFTKYNSIPDIETFLGQEYDFLSDDYPIDKADIIIMNPPYSIIEPFVIRALEIAPEVLLLGRMQFIEGSGRYENILKDNPFNEMYQYVDRIQCYKNGDELIKSSSVQGYAWFYWNQNLVSSSQPRLKWIRRA